MYIRLFSDPVMKQVCVPVDPLDASLPTLLEEMRQKMLVNRGIGLAGPQVGINKQIAVIKNGENIFYILNPKIIWRSPETIKLEEGCLSAPGARVVMQRSTSITIEYDEVGGGKKREIWLDLLAAIGQHETDHLQGFCIVNTLD